MKCGVPERCKMHMLQLSMGIVAVVLFMNDGAFAQNSGVHPGITVDPSLQTAPLEPERVAPQTSLTLPIISTKSGNVTYLQYDYLAQDQPCTPVVVLDVPQFYAPRSSAGPTKTWQVPLLVRFRSEDNAFEAGTPELFGCVGHCNGRMTLMISNGLGEKEREVQRVFHRATDDPDRVRRNNSFVVGQQTDPHFRYKRYRYVKANPSANTDYYSDADNEALASYVLECNPRVPVPQCRSYVDLPNYRWINLEINFDMLYLPIWERVRDSAIRFISSMVRKTVVPLSCR
jgi:hypothetical protein